MNTSLIDIGLEYSSEEDFKRDRPDKYLIAKRRGLLRMIFPPVIQKKIAKGIYFLLNSRGTPTYVGYTITSDVTEALYENAEAVEASTRYRYYLLDSEADIVVLYTYFVALYRPKHNKTAPHELTFKIPNISQLLGTIYKGDLYGNN